MIAEGLGRRFGSDMTIFGTTAFCKSYRKGDRDQQARRCIMR